MASFNYTPRLQDPQWLLRPILPTDLDGLYACASDSRVWAQHPNRDRHQRDKFDAWFADASTNRALVLQRRHDLAIAGSSRFYQVDTEPRDMCIGYTFLGLDYWGGAVNLAMKSLMLNHAFTQFERVWFHIDPANMRSRKGTEKIGARYVREEENSLSDQGVRWSCYVLDRATWQLRQRESS